MKQTRIANKLQLRAETVRQLDRAELPAAAGGLPTTTITRFTCVCPSVRVTCLTTPEGGVQ